jgi:hypothetical protein
LRGPTSEQQVYGGLTSSIVRVVICPRNYKKPTDTTSFQGVDYHKTLINLRLAGRLYGRTSG